MKAASIAVCMLSGLVVSSARAETVVMRETVKGDQVVGNFSQDTPITCADETEGSFHIGVVVIANDLVQRSDFFPQVLDQVEVFLFTRNSCTEEVAQGMGVIQNPDFKISAQQKATISGTVTPIDFFTGLPMDTVTFNLAFTGVGDVFRFQFQDRFAFDNITINLHTVGRSREATVSGSILVGGEELIDNFLSGSLGRTRSGFLQITRN